MLEPAKLPLDGPALGVQVVVPLGGPGDDQGGIGQRGGCRLCCASCRVPAAPVRFDNKHDSGGNRPFATSVPANCASFDRSVTICALQGKSSGGQPCTAVISGAQLATISTGSCANLAPGAGLHDEGGTSHVAAARPALIRDPLWSDRR